MQGCICPHPPLLIPEIGGEARAQVRVTVDGMQRLADAVGEAETVVIVSPHSAGYTDAHVVKTASRLEGDFGAFRCPQVRLTFENDLPFVDLLLALAGQERRLSIIPADDGLLDHGVLVPMSFLRTRRLVSLSIVNEYGEHRALGQLVRRCAAELGRDVLFVASGDMSHRLSPSAPAGYDPRGKMFDDHIVELLGVGDFAGLAELDRTIVSGAGECGLRSFIALGGFLGDDAEKAPTLYSYEGPVRRRLPGRRLRRRGAGRGRRMTDRPVGPGSPQPAGAPEQTDDLSDWGPADYALACVDRFVRGLRPPPPPDQHFYAIRAACFVSLKKQGELRGCIGTLEPAEPDLGREIPRNAYCAAFQDPRFPPVGEDELEALVCSVDVLSPSEECGIGDLDAQLYGVIVSCGVRRGVLLPALLGVDDVATQLAIALQKAGISRDDPFDVRRFTVARYREGDRPAPDVAGAGDEVDG